MNGIQVFHPVPTIKQLAPVIAVCATGRPTDEAGETTGVQSCSDLRRIFSFGPLETGKVIAYGSIYFAPEPPSLSKCRRDVGSMS
ncbi:hypothetical protein E2542_SST00824 [Spatholobus suberectus]|nr:hypothetical protein E2542_SST00824 [Spatholobus suberectus]